MCKFGNFPTESVPSLRSFPKSSESPSLVFLSGLIGEENYPHAFLHEVGLQGYLVPGLDGEPLALGWQLTEEFLMVHAKVTVYPGYCSSAHSMTDFFV